MSPPRSPSPPVARGSTAVPADARATPTDVAAPPQPLSDGGDDAHTEKRLAMTRDVRTRIETVQMAAELLRSIGCDFDERTRNQLKEFTINSFAPYGKGK